MSAVEYPAAPWRMNGQLWLSLFRVRRGDHSEREPGVYGVALVHYQEPSPLTYAELLVARPVRVPKPAVHITDIWVDSEASMHGGRELWAIPKDLCDFVWLTSTTGRLHRTGWTARLDGKPIASAWFSDVSQAAPRMPFRGHTWQTRAIGHPQAGTEVIAPIAGSARTLPCKGAWSFAHDGPLGWLHGKRPLASFRMRDFQMSFG